MPSASRANKRVTLKRHLIDEGQLRILAFLSKRNGVKIEDVLNGLIADFNKTHLHEYLGEILAQPRNDHEITHPSHGGDIPECLNTTDQPSDANNGTCVNDANIRSSLGMPDHPSNAQSFSEASIGSSKINLKSLAKEIGEMSREDFIKAYSGKIKSDDESNKFKDIFTIEESVELCMYREKYSVYHKSN